jgi:cobalt-zinc-cadmium efflux system protein
VGHDHAHPSAAGADRRWLGLSLSLLLIFLIGEVIAGLLAHSTALLTDAAHLLTDVVALGMALVAIRVAARPARGAYTYGFARVDALAGQTNGITLLILAAWFVVAAVRHLIHPASTTGSVVTFVALIGVVVNVLAAGAAAKADRDRLSVKGAVAHLVNDLWAFVATAVAGIVIVVTGWTRADAIASLVIAALMLYTGVGLVRAAGRVFLEAAPRDLDPKALGAQLAGIDGVAQVHDLHVWQIGPGEPALSAHVLVSPHFSCHEVGARLRKVLADDHSLAHATLQLDHEVLTADGTMASHVCEDSHGPVHTSN